MFSVSGRERIIVCWQPGFNVISCSKIGHPAFERGLLDALNLAPQKNGINLLFSQLIQAKVNLQDKFILYFCNMKKIGKFLFCFLFSHTFTFHLGR